MQQVRSVEGQRKIVTVLYGKDRVEIDPSGFVSTNGARKPIQVGFYRVFYRVLLDTARF